MATLSQARTLDRLVNLGTSWSDDAELLRRYRDTGDSEAFAGIAGAAERAGLAVVGHVPRAVGLEGALALGQASIDHAEEYLYTFFQSGGAELVPEAVDRFPADVLDDGADGSGGRGQREQREPDMAEVMGAPLLTLADP